MRNSLASVVILGLLGASAPAVLSAVKIDEQVVGPANDTAKYVVSLHGVHLATVAPKGSRVTVVVDGVTGPRFDEIVQTGGVIDSRLYQGLDQNSDLIPRGGFVTFSNDGSRYAYLGRLGQEWVFMVDNKENFRIPVQPGGHGILIALTGESGKHVLFAREVYGGYELWVDGQKWPGFFAMGGGGSEGTIDPIISPDGAHIAYMAQIDREKRALIVDGKDAGYFGVNLHYTPDSKHLISVRQTQSPQQVLVDGKPVFSSEQIVNLHLSPVGNRMIIERWADRQAQLVVDGKPLVIDGKPVESGGTVVFSPDGKHYAALCGKAPNMFVVIDGKKGQEYFTINATDLSTLSQGIAFSPDSSKLVYTAMTTNGGYKMFVVINEDESDAFGLGAKFWFSPDGKHLAYAGTAAQATQKGILMMDGKSAPLPSGWAVDAFLFSPDSSHYVFHAARGGDSGLFLDGKNTGIGLEYQSRGLDGCAFSPDGKHFAVRGGRDGKNGLLVDGQLVYDTNGSAGLLHEAFTPDGQHLFWVTREAAIGAKAAPGNWEYVVYLDGKQVARCEADLYTPTRQIGQQFMQIFGSSSWVTPRGWRVNAAGQLVFLGTADDDVKRFTITPSSDTNVYTMIAEAKSGGPKSKVTEKSATPASPQKSGAVASAPTGQTKPAADVTPSPIPTTEEQALQVAVTAANALPGAAGTTARKATTIATEAEQAKAELAKAKTEIKSVWEKLKPKK